MANGENRITAHIREQLRSAHWLLEETVSDVTEEMAHFALPGMALPIGAAYAHYVTGEDWTAEFERWCRRVRVDLPAFRAYARAVYEATDTYLASLPDAGLSRPLDLSAMGMGTQNVGFVLNNAVLGHAYCHCGEISAAKGLPEEKGVSLLRESGTLPASGTDNGPVGAT